jgi:hypothetical protein
MAIQAGMIITVASAIFTAWENWQDRRDARKAAAIKERILARAEAKIRAAERARIEADLWVDVYNDETRKRAGKGRRDHGGTVK